MSKQQLITFFLGAALGYALAPKSVGLRIVAVAFNVALAVAVSLVNKL